MAAPRKVLFTVPGRLGDALFRLPIAYQYALEHKITVDICLDHTLVCMIPLLQKQTWVRTVFYEAGIYRWDNGGQPYDFGGHPDFKLWPQVYHLGYRNPPNGNLTMSSYRQSEVPLSPEREARLLVSSCIHCPADLPIRPPRDLCVHVSAGIDHSSPNTARRNKDALATIMPVIDKLAFHFDKVLLVGRGDTDETRYLMGLGHPKIRRFDDGGDLWVMTKQLCKSILIGTYSSMWALATIANLPQVVIMDQLYYTPDKIANPRCQVVFPENGEGLYHWTMSKLMNWDRQ